MRARLALFAFLAVAAVACGDSIDSSSAPDLCANSGAAATVTVADDYTFTPDTVTITTGQLVCWQNTGHLTHYVSEYLDRWGSQLPGGQTYVHTFAGITGSIPYYCRQHSNMAGMVIVNP